MTLFAPKVHQSIRVFPVFPIIIAGWCLLALLGAAKPAAAQSARDLLLNSLKPHVTAYVGEQVSEVDDTNIPRSSRYRPSEQKVYRKGNILRIEYPDGRILFDDGERQLLYLPRLHVVETKPSGFLKSILDRQKRTLFVGKVHIEQLPDDAVAGRPTHVILIRRNEIERRVWIDKQTAVQLRQDVARANGRITRTYFRSIAFQEPSADKLSYTPPPGVPIVDEGRGRPLSEETAAALAKSWGGLLVPQNPPPGYLLRGYYRHEFQGQPLLVAMYANPRRKGAVSVFQGSIRGMSMVSDRYSGDLRVRAGRKGNTDVLIIGSLSEEEMQQMMNSLAPQ